MTRIRSGVSIVTIAFAMVIGAMAPAAVGKGPPPGKGPGGHTEAATNNLSYPAIFPDGKPAGWVEVDDWTFAPVASPTACIGEEGVTVGASVPTDILCYDARRNTGIDEKTGVRGWVDETARVWWLQERAQNRWQVYDPVMTTPLVVSAIDFGDLLESTPLIRQKQVRTEVSLLQTADAALLGTLGAQLFADATIPPFAWEGRPVFAAMMMSGAVPGTDQSQNEIQGGDYGPGPSGGLLTGTGTLVDPRTVKPGFDATVYSTRALLVIQKLTGPDLAWDADLNRWVGDASAPVVDVSAAAGTYSAEINAGGSLIYGYNWNTTRASLGSGRYRITFVLDGGANTRFGATTVVANPGERNTAVVLAAGGSTGAGLAFIDLDVAVSGRGGGGGGGGRPR